MARPHARGRRGDGAGSERVSVETAGFVRAARDAVLTDGAIAVVEVLLDEE